MHFFDTSILVAAFDDQDSSHEKSFSIFSQFAEEGGIAVHTMAETFSILTGRRGWRAGQAFEALETNTADLQKIMLDAADYLKVCKEAEALGIRGGAVYDALILACARKAGATQIWTLNVRHFEMFAPDLSGVIKEP